jgi:DNA-binding MarR family transcriptional regulator
MKTIADLNLTQLETQVLTCLIDMLYAEEGFSDVDAKDIANEIKVNIKSVRGAVGSLVKKGIVYIEETNTWGAPIYQLIYLQSDYYFLHPEWSKQHI